MPFTKIACSPIDAMVAVEGENIRSVTVGDQCRRPRPSGSSRQAG
jgi:hypothetical protein